MKKMFSFLLPMALLVWEAVADPANRTSFPAVEGITTVFLITKQQDLAEDNKNITGLPCEEMSNTSWTNLTLMDKGLISFPSCLPKTVEILDLSDNKLSVLDMHEIVQLFQLRALTLRRNVIEGFNCTEEGSSNLEALDISYNQLQSVPGCSALLQLKQLSLAGNPITKLEPFAFACFPNLAFLNLSTTLLGNITNGGISELSFALKMKGDREEMPMATMNVLDLSETFLLSIQPEWMKDLPNLKELHIMKMNSLESLDTNVLKYLPNLSLLNCQNSRTLSLVRTEIFEDAPHLNYLDFQNCNLSTLNPWNSSSSALNINLYGNPLKCSCELSWLFSDPKRIVLHRAEETICSNRTNGESSSFLSLLEFYNECKSNRSTKAIQPENTTNMNIQYYSDITIRSHSNAPSTAEARTTFPLLPFKDSNLHSSVSTIQIDQSTLHYKDITVNSITHALSTKVAEGSVPFPDEISMVSFNLHNTLPTIQTDGLKKKVLTVNPSNRSPNAEVPIHYVSDDYDYREDHQEKSTTQSKTILCDYHPCKHLQKPCLELQSLSQCFCPGLSGEGTIPDSPRLRDVTEITDTSAQIHWCAPNSVVDKYQLAYHPEGSKNRTVVDDIYVTARQYTLYSLSPGTTYQVCIIACNKAGSSELVNENFSRSPCIELKTKPSYTIILAVLCSTSGILLIAIVILSVCLCKMSKKPQADQYDTHLISYKNPAFDYQLKTQTINSITE
ncbi:leucine-rich repeat neuronal protein 4 [Rhinatrema bivittatum]|uniref:leucine-rich repeat neuronal protein 4 n=1 Tax=Rhinatrema bivittatum TaxID=194408 RepID=UPI001127098F|nr:leucine-rich repeat neuronal protein 4 [Rhinatrema bivittatum]